MSGIASVSVHIVRPGQPHNALISPVTAYLGMCGAFGVSTLTIDWEQADLEQQLASLRYTRPDDNGGRSLVPADERQHALVSMGRKVGHVFGQIGGLGSELALAETRVGADGLVHLRLRLWGNELAMLPFEVAVGAPGMRSEGRGVSLNRPVPICITREMLGASAMPVCWDRPVRVLYAWASPGGEVPYLSNLYGLHTAVSQLVPWARDAKETRAALNTLLTVLPFASIEDIRQACARDEYTHVYLLAHGAASRFAGHMRYGVALHRATGSAEAQVVTGEELAVALGAAQSGNAVRPMPNVVTLAICDSGNQGSVVVPGGSVAHALHERGVGWVVASQFPLNFGASDVLAGVWMDALLRGCDPRWALVQLRSALGLQAGAQHDWGSIVAYGALPESFDGAAPRFTRRQALLRLRLLETGVRQEEANAREGWTRGAAAPPDEALTTALTTLAACVEAVCADVATFFPPPPPPDPELSDRDREVGNIEVARYEEYSTLSAALTKRVGVAMRYAGMGAAAVATLRAARARYELAASHHRTRHWPLVQALAIGVLLDEDVTPRAWHAAHDAAVAAAEGTDLNEAVWGWSSRLELLLLASAPELAGKGGVPAAETLPALVKRVAGEFARRAKAGVPYAIPSVRRQLDLYAALWVPRITFARVEEALKVLPSP